ncbi:hypothetical protein PRIPAC_78084 [Pristionchus pacificus]|uniref:Uncharacterized protein n=1 Tax=Pristionchus pacificus TaxID=54126 RepID=A0A454XQX1_PRIPA|nr:hypothetical protein PRIPAC_78084 [Pristionchus pacificus]|eukprot:PDM70728.1 hypothetical protein PRIPAC_44932 [Pristionchus pacificus]
MILRTFLAAFLITVCFAEEETRNLVKRQMPYNPWFPGPFFGGPGGNPFFVGDQQFGFPFYGGLPPTQSNQPINVQYHRHGNNGVSWVWSTNPS